MTATAPARPPEHDELRALIEEARRRARRRRRRYGIGLLLAVVSGAGLYLLLAPGSRRAGGAFGDPDVTLAAPRTFGPGQFWYTRTISTQHQWMPAGGTIERRPGYIRPRGAEVRFTLRVSDETWVGVDGTVRDRMIVTSARFASPADRARWSRYGRPVPNFNQGWLGWTSHDGITVGARFPPQPSYRWYGEWVGPGRRDVADSLFSYRELLALPTRPAALRARLTRAEQRLARREAQTGWGVASAQTDAFGQLGDIAGLLMSPVPAAERLALFHAAVTMPGVRVNLRAHDSLGRPGIAVNASSGLAFEGLVFDRATGALLEDAPFAVVAQAVVGSAYALPKGISPIRGTGAPRAPQAAAITPAVGGPRTVFEVMLPAPEGRRWRHAPALDWLVIGTPGSGCFGWFAPLLPPLVGPAGVRHGVKLTYVYRLGPSRIKRRTWCRGRYELSVLPDYSGRADAAYVEATASLLPVTGSSIFFRVS